MVTHLWLFNSQIFKLLSSNESFGHAEQSFQVMDCKITILDETNESRETKDSLSWSSFYYQLFFTITKALSL